MSPKLKRITGIVGFVILFALVVYWKTERKMNRFETKETNKEMIQKQLEYQEQMKNQLYEITAKKQQAKRDSVAKLKRDSLQAKICKTQSIIKTLEKEINENK